MDNQYPEAQAGSACSESEDPCNIEIDVTVSYRRLMHIMSRDQQNGTQASQNHELQYADRTVTSNSGREIDLPVTPKTLSRLQDKRPSPLDRWKKSFSETSDAEVEPALDRKSDQRFTRAR